MKQPPSVPHRMQNDTVSAFHVIEHVSDPFGFTPSNLINTWILAERLLHSSPRAVADHHTLPTSSSNAHLITSSWNKAPLRALADRLGLVVETVESCPVRVSRRRRFRWDVSLRDLSREPLLPRPLDII